MKKHTFRPTHIALLAAGSTALAAAEPQLLFENSDFELGSLKNWTIEGNAFKSQPTKGDNPANRGRQDGSKHQGDFWICHANNAVSPSELKPKLAPKPLL